MVSDDAFRDGRASTLPRLVRQLGREAIEGSPTRTLVNGVIRGAQGVDNRSGRVRCCDRVHVLAQE